MLAVVASSIVQVSPDSSFFLTILQSACLYVLLHLTCVACCLQSFPFFLYLLSVHSEKKKDNLPLELSFFFFLSFSLPFSFSFAVHLHL